MGEIWNLEKLARSVDADAMAVIRMDECDCLRIHVGDDIQNDSNIGGCSMVPHDNARCELDVEKYCWLGDEIVA